MAYSVKDKLKQSYTRLVRPVQNSLQQTQLAKIAYERQRSQGATRGQQIGQAHIMPRLQQTVNFINARPNIQKPLMRASNFLQSKDQSMLGQFGSGIAQGSNMGFGQAPLPAPTTGRGKAAYTAGSLLGAFNPKSITGKVTGSIVRATNPILAKAVSPVANKAITGRLVSGAANVAQGAAINPLYGRKPLEGAALDFVSGAAFGPSQFGARGMAKGFDFGRNKNMKWDANDVKELDAITDFLRNKKLTNADLSEADKVITSLARGYLPVSVMNKLSSDYGKNSAGYLRAMVKELDKSAKRLGAYEAFDELKRSDDFDIPNLFGGNVQMGIVGKTDQIRPKVEQVEQVFKADKFNLNSKQTKTLDGLRKTLGYEKRGVRTFDDMKEMAEVLGTDPGRIIKDIQTNRINDKEVVALGNVISTSSQRIEKLQKLLKQNPSDPKVLNQLDVEERLLNTAIGKRIRGGTELGRGVAAFRIIANKNLDPVYWLSRAQKQLGPENQLNTEQISAINDLIKSKDRIGLAKFVSMLGESTLREKALGLWKAGLLTSFRTHAGNLISNTAFGALETAKDVPATAFDIARSAITGNPRAKSFGVKNITKQVGGAIEGAKQAKTYFTEGIDVRDANKLDSFKPLRFGKSKLGRLAQKYTNTVYGALGAEDKVFREMAVKRSLAEQAGVMGINKKLNGAQIENLINNPTEEMITQAVKDAEYATFTNPNAISDAVSAAKRSGGKLTSTILDFTMPFVRTPSNVLKAVLDYTPVGFVEKTVKKLSSGASISDKELANAFGRSVTGTALIWSGYKLAEAGKIQGSSPSGEAERSQMYLEGRQPNSVLVNGKWRSISRISPLGNLLVLGAEYFNSNKDLVETASAGAKALTEQSFLKGASSAISAVSDPRRGAKKYVESAVGGIVPNIVKDVARGRDDYMRQTNSKTDSIKYGLPGMRETLPVRLDAMGNPVKQEGGYLTALFDPSNPKSATNDPIILEMKRVGYNLNEIGDTLNNQKLTPAEKSAYQRKVGEKIKQVIPAVIQSQAYKSADIDTQNSLIEKAVNKSKDLAREEIKPLLGKIKPESGIKVGAAEATSNNAMDVGQTKKEYSYIDETGSLKIVDVSPLAKPKMSGQEELDVKLVSKYKSGLTKKINGVVDLFEAGQLSSDEAEKLIQSFKQEYDALKKKSGGKKAKKFISDAQILSSYRKALEAFAKPRARTKSFSEEMGSRQSAPIRLKRQKLAKLY